MSDAAPWTIKAMPVATRQRAVRSAQMQDQTVAQWLADAVTRLADQQAGNQVIPPGKPEHAAVPLPEIDLAGLGAAIMATVEAFRAGGGAPPKNLGSNAAATLNKYMRAARGLSEGKPAGKLPPAIGQTRCLEQALSPESVDRTGDNSTERRRRNVFHQPRD